jgi:uncharacterized protein (DUF983 family)
MPERRDEADPTALSDVLAPPQDRARRDRARRGIGASAVPSSSRALARGLVKRCPRCGQNNLFSRWFTLATVCPRCGLQFQRQEGGFLGAIALNYTAAVVLWAAMLTAWLVVDLPDVNVAALTAASVGLVVASLLLLYPTSKTIWAAIEYLVYRSEMRGQR